MATCFLSIFFGINPMNVYTINRVRCDDYTNQYDFTNSEEKSTYSVFEKKTGNTFYFIPDLTINNDYITKSVQAVYSSETFVF
jgi:hypothetical protein